MGTPRGGVDASVSAGANTLAIGIMAKAAVSGYAKTRMIPLLGADGAARLQAELTDRSLRTACAAAPGRVTLFTTGGDAQTHWLDYPRRYAVDLCEQQGEDLGQRMAHALSRLLRCAARAVLIGTDCPALTPEHLRAAGACLSAQRMVFMPAEDGGYVLVGVAHTVPDVFCGIDWGTDRVMQQTRTALQRLGWQAGADWSEPGTLPDLDRPEDYHRALREGWLQPPAAVESRVAR